VPKPASPMPIGLLIGKGVDYRRAPVFL